ncbi:MAG: hypothetical protein LC102_07040 [Ignavibacteriales bacterium]|nr:MAG: hypothetical protein F9K26_10815 [Ignavibacteriaceae bacterium]MBV6444045.1 hypothetical protein [Ignavibacteriaceae bacterium]MBW7874065.1 hypothetical protein [Ignavibacteria bacterium]MCZ2143165.1 hypothetical protein [Ignavibacteriales bacterium]WKZ72506.1 MAG: hypothetical protein QY308_12890 [Ignavibacteriaceae bacterium]
MNKLNKLNKEEARGLFSPLPAVGERLPEKGSMPDGSFYLLRKTGLKILFLFIGGERLPVATLPAVLERLPTVEGLPELTTVFVKNGSAVEQHILIRSVWQKIS